MKVYIVSHCYFYESSAVIAVFSDLAKAVRYCDNRPGYAPFSEYEWRPKRIGAQECIYIEEAEVDSE